MPARSKGLAFSPKGMRFGVARYNGVTLHFPAADGKPVELQWEGAHTAISFSPDGNFVVTAMQENALHGWKLADGKHMRMTGYPAKVKSLSWSAKGKWLASSGAPAAILWPFQSKDGPMGKAPMELGTRGNTMVSAVACHPTDDIVAIGYQDGMVLAARFADAEGGAAAPSRQRRDQLDDVGRGRPAPGLRLRDRRLRRDRHFGLARRLSFGRPHSAPQLISPPSAVRLPSPRHRPSRTRSACSCRHRAPRRRRPASR